MSGFGFVIRRSSAERSTGEKQKRMQLVLIVIDADQHLGPVAIVPSPRASVSRRDLYLVRI